MTLVAEPIAAPAADPNAPPEEFAVVVTQKHIDEGAQNSGEFCAIALAIRDLGFDLIEVNGYGTAEFWGPLAVDDDELWDVVRYAAEGAEAFVDAFDEDKLFVHPERFVYRRVRTDAA